MKFQSIISLLTFFAAWSSFSLDARFYYCNGSDVGFTYLHVLNGDEHHLDVEIAGAKTKIKIPKVSEVNGNFYIFAKTKGPHQITSLEFLLESPVPSQLPNDMGVIQFPETFKTWVNLDGARGKEQREVECELFGLTERFFDEIGACIP